MLVSSVRHCPSSPAISDLCRALTDGQRHIVNRCAKGPGPYVVSTHSHYSPSVFVKRSHCRASPVRPGHRRISLSRLGPTRVHPSCQGCATSLTTGLAALIWSWSTLILRRFAPGSTNWVQLGLSATEREIRTATAVAAIADTINCLAAEVPPSGREGGVGGPMGGGYIQHSFFGVRSSTPQPRGNT